MGYGRVSAQSAVQMAAALAAVEKPWLTLAGPFMSFLIQTGVDKAFFGAPFLAL